MPARRLWPGSTGFTDFELDTGRRELRRDGANVHVEPQVFDVLTRLIVDAGTSVTKD